MAFEKKSVAMLFLFLIGSISLVSAAPMNCADVNEDGVVNIFDLSLAGGSFGQQGANLAADVNKDGVVNIFDLSLIAGAFGTSADPGVCNVAGAVCGDGNLDAGEECDDGNLINGDGCSDVCQVENILPPIGEPIKIEAEDTSLNGLVVEDETDASAERVVSRRNAGGTEGTASYTFAGSSGLYDIGVGYFDENDGQSQATLKLNGNIIDSWLFDQDLGSNFPDPDNFVLRTKADVQLSNGDTIELVLVEGQDEYGRTDYFEFYPKSCGQEGAEDPCYTGPEGTLGKGPCAPGRTICQADGTRSACEGQSLPTTEIVNGIDDDCDGLVDNIDNDGDGFAIDVDCDDNDAGINPGASEVCGDGKDNDCNNLIDKDDGTQCQVCDQDCGRGSGFCDQVECLSLPGSCYFEPGIINTCNLCPTSCGEISSGKCIEVSDQCEVSCEVRNNVCMSAVQGDFTADPSYVLWDIFQFITLTSNDPQKTVTSSVSASVYGIPLTTTYIDDRTIKIIYKSEQFYHTDLLDIVINSGDGNTYHAYVENLEQWSDIKNNDRDAKILFDFETGTIDPVTITHSLSFSRLDNPIVVERVPEFNNNYAMKVIFEQTTPDPRPRPWIKVGSSPTGRGTPLFEAMGGRRWMKWRVLLEDGVDPGKSLPGDYHIDHDASRITAPTDNTCNVCPAVCNLINPDPSIPGVETCTALSDGDYPSPEERNMHTYSIIDSNTGPLSAGVYDIYLPYTRARNNRQSGGAFSGVNFLLETVPKGTAYPARGTVSGDNPLEFVRADGEHFNSPSATWTRGYFDFHNPDSSRHTVAFDDISVISINDGARLWGDFGITDVSSSGQLVERHFEIENLEDNTKGFYVWMQHGQSGDRSIINNNYGGGEGIFEDLNCDGELDSAEASDQLLASGGTSLTIGRLSRPIGPLQTRCYVARILSLGSGKVKSSFINFVEVVDGTFGWTSTYWTTEDDNGNLIRGRNIPFADDGKQVLAGIHQYTNTRSNVPSGQVSTPQNVRALRFNGNLGNYWVVWDEVPDVARNAVGRYIVEKAPTSSGPWSYYRSIAPAVTSAIANDETACYRVITVATAERLSSQPVRSNPSSPVCF